MAAELAHLKEKNRKLKEENKKLAQSSSSTKVDTEKIIENVDRLSDRLQLSYRNAEKSFMNRINQLETSSSESEMRFRRKIQKLQQDKSNLERVVTSMQNKILINKHEDEQKELFKEIQELKARIIAKDTKHNDDTN